MLSQHVTETAAGSADLAVVVMLVALVAFFSALLWVYLGKKESDLNYESRLPLD